MIYPRLEIARRGFNHKRRFEPGLFHVRYRSCREVVNERKAVLVFRAAEDISSVTVLSAEPRNRPEKSLAIPNAGQHYRGSVTRVRIKQAQFERFAAHRADLRLNRSGCSVGHGSFLKGQGPEGQCSEQPSAWQSSETSAKSE